MKKHLLVLACACVLFAATPAAAFPSHRAQDTTTVHKSKWSWFHKNKQPNDKKPAKGEKGESLHKFPKSVGWWRHQPGPAGAGAK